MHRTNSHDSFIYRLFSYSRTSESSWNILVVFARIFFRFRNITHQSRLHRWFQNHPMVKIQFLDFRILSKWNARLVPRMYSISHDHSKERTPSYTNVNHWSTIIVPKLTSQVYEVKNTMSSILHDRRKKKKKKKEKIRGPSYVQRVRRYSKISNI